MTTAQLPAVKRGQKKLALLSRADKDAILLKLAKLIGKNEILLQEKNKADLSALALDTLASYRDRLTLTPERIKAVLDSIQAIIRLDDPVGRIEYDDYRADLHFQKVSAPIGTLFVIFESRPNVAIDAFCLALKSGNAVVLRGGSEAVHTLSTLYMLIKQALVESGHWSADQLPFLGVEDYNRDVIQQLLGAREYLDLVIPRGGAGLIRHVCANTEIPVLKNDRGLCHAYVHEKANLAWAAKIVKNGKTQRPGVCNALETLLVDRKIAASFLPEFSKDLGVEWRCCAESLPLIAAPLKKLAAPEDWDTEYLDLILNCRIVDGLDQAIEHIAAHGSKHSEAIITDDANISDRFVAEVDAAVTYVNASTRFTDGGEMGMGAEIGISTQKIHARGPIGLRELTTGRWIAHGKGTVRK